MKKIIEEGGLIPRGYGVAWRSNYGMKVVCYPIPINLIVRWFNDCWCSIMHGLWKSRWESMLLNIRMEEYRKFKQDFENRLLALKGLENLLRKNA